MLTSRNYRVFLPISVINEILYEIKYEAENKTPFFVTLSNI